MNYETATLEELHVEFVRLGGSLSVMANQRQEILTEMDKRKADAKARSVVDGMTDLEREALKAIAVNFSKSTP